jgi:hypothetical protein
VREFGAKGDGATNDRAAIQAALDAAQPGAAVYFPAGTYLLADSGLKVSKSQITLFGDGPSSVLVHGGHVGLNLGPDGQALTGLVVRQLKFVGLPGKYKADGNEGSGIELFGPKGTLISDCDFQGCGYPINNAGAVGTTHGTQIQNCRVNGWGSVAIFCNGGEQISGCQLIQDDPDRLGERSSHGMYIHSGASDVTVSDTLIQNARKYGIQIYGQDVGTVTARVEFHRVTIKDCAYGFTISSFPVTAARAQNVVIDGCTFSGTYNGASVSLKNGDGVQVTNNLIEGSYIGLALGRWDPYEPGGWISNLTATGNIIRNCETGIYALASAGGHFENVSVTGNTITNCPTPVFAPSTPGITVSV